MACSRLQWPGVGLQKPEEGLRVDLEYYTCINLMMTLKGLWLWKPLETWKMPAKACRDLVDLQKKPTEIWSKPEDTEKSTASLLTLKLLKTE